VTTMPEPITDEQLAQWGALADAASDGPWDPDVDRCAIYDENEEPVLHADTLHPELIAPNLLFAAAARTALPRLLAEVQRLTAELDAAHQTIRAKDADIAHLRREALAAIEHRKAETASNERLHAELEAARRQLHDALLWVPPKREAILREQWDTPPAPAQPTPGETEAVVKPQARDTCLNCGKPIYLIPAADGVKRWTHDYYAGLTNCDGMRREPAAPPAVAAPGETGGAS